MSANSKATKILKELNFDFTTFTMDGFLRRVSQARGREIITIPWNMPTTLFGAWISDADQPREYIFYRNDLPRVHQIHIQLHELSHFLFGHPTLRINQKRIADAVAGKAPLPFDEIIQFRAPRFVTVEEPENVDVEAESLAHLIQEQVVRRASLAQLTSDLSIEQNFADFVKTLGLA